MSIFLSKRANGIYYLWFKDDLGRKRKVSTRCKLKTDALKFLQDFKQKEAEGKARLQRTSVSLFAQDYLKYSKGVHTAKSQESIRTSLCEFIRIIGDLSLHKIGAREIENFIATKKSETSEQTARTYFVTLASAFEAAKRWNCIAENPFRRVQKPNVRELQPAYLSKADFRRLLGAVKEKDIRELFISAVSTGIRLSELTALQWPDVDQVQKVIHVRNTDTFTTKSKKNSVVPMSDQLCQMMTQRKEEAASELVFHRNGRRLAKDYLSKKFKRTVRLAGLNEKLHFHSLRHTISEIISFLASNKPTEKSELHHKPTYPLPARNKKPLGEAIFND